MARVETSNPEGKGGSKIRFAGHFSFRFHSVILASGGGAFVPPPCTDDPTRVIFVRAAGRLADRTILAGSGGERQNTCRQFDGDEATCEDAAARDECFGCGPSSQGEDQCANVCETGGERALTAAPCGG